MEVSCKARQVGKELTVDYNFGENLAEAVKLFGEDVVFSLYRAKGVIIIQDLVRRLLTDGKTEEEVAKTIAEYKLGVVLPRGKKKSPKETLQAAIASAKTPEDLKAIEDMVKAQMAALTGKK
jgi:hypothetical protein